ncbi:OmpA family protein [Variovorax terrae]|uniref:OmpA family protein n=1 Tax=Variovorax terrae TaxID=2923278 RepID=A0A9X2AP85_9BURK|nr:OmpA family protein [Variovorax terrae]MCJ0764600.1 OmpA family protein [Variovorax terrae]
MIRISRITGAALLALAALGVLPAAAQPAPTAEQMIEQLKAAPQAPRTRSLRNLTVEAASAARPSLSLLIQFDFDSARVRPESQQALANLAQALQSSELSASKFVIEGHTDAKGRADYNQRLSQQRADAVRDYLAQQGVAVVRLTAAGKGSSEPANAADPFAAENRRVRIVNLD